MILFLKTQQLFKLHQLLNSNMRVGQSLLKRVVSQNILKIDTLGVDLNPNEEKIVKQFENSVVLMKKLNQNFSLLNDLESKNVLNQLNDSKLKIDKLLLNSAFYSMGLKDQLSVINQNLHLWMKKIQESRLKSKQSGVTLNQPDYSGITFEGNQMVKSTKNHNFNPFENDQQMEVKPAKDEQINEPKVVYRNPFDEEEIELKKPQNDFKIKFNHKNEPKKITNFGALPMSNLEKGVIQKKIEVPKLTSNLLEMEEQNKNKNDDWLAEINDTKKNNDSIKKDDIFDVKFF